MESQYALTREEIEDLITVASKLYRSPIDRGILNALLTYGLQHTGAVSPDTGYSY